MEQITVKEFQRLLNSQKNATVKLLLSSNKIITKMMFKNVDCKLDKNNHLIISDFYVKLEKIEKIKMSIVFGVVYYEITYKDNQVLELKIYSEDFRESCLNCMVAELKKDLENHRHMISRSQK
jgi:hypothetical protein